jgi:PIN domain nuclease of toxin-antitoxin system
MSEEHVLDASALLAWLQNEPGAEKVILHHSLMNAVNWSEVLQKAEQHGVDTQDLESDLSALGLIITPFSLEEARLAAALYPITRPLGLSLADRACLATAQLRGRQAVTAEKRWTVVGAVPVVLIR